MGGWTETITFQKVKYENRFSLKRNVFFSYRYTLSQSYVPHPFLPVGGDKGKIFEFHYNIFSPPSCYLFEQILKLMCRQEAAGAYRHKSDK